MTTTIKSTALDFDNIKNNLKVYLQAQEEFEDYNFEASGLSNLLDVLAYNTHINALTANFALNESYLGTAQLRSSLVSLAEGVGYIPDSRTSAMATINLSLTFSAVSRPQRVELPAFQLFNSSVDGTAFTFYTLDDIEAVDDGSGNYVFKTAEDSINIPIREGVQRTKKFLVGQPDDNIVYVIPDKNLDLSTVSVKVYDTATATVYTTYTNITEAIALAETSTLYVLKESPNGYFELSFGNGTALGTIPTSGNMVEVDYISTSGPDANAASLFSTTISLDGVSTSDYTVDDIVTVAPAVGGSYKEDIESIRKNAPYLYASQNRMVTAADYSALILRKYSSLISDIVAWGGQDNIVPEFGKIFVSILFNDDVSESTITSTKNDITALASQLAVLSFGLTFSDPQITYIETGVSFEFNSALTDLPLGSVETTVKNAAVDYFTTNLGKFGQSFRLSNMLTDVDDVSTAVLSSSSSIKMQQRVTPILSYNNDFTLRYPVPIKVPDDVENIVTSSVFVYNGVNATIKNKLNSTTLQIVNDADDSVIIDNVGDYVGSTGMLTLVAFAPANILGGVDYVKISVIPANKNAITPTNNDVLYHDVGASTAIGTVV